MTWDQQGSWIANCNSYRMLVWFIMRKPLYHTSRYYFIKQLFWLCVNGNCSTMIYLPPNICLCKILAYYGEVCNIIHEISALSIHVSGKLHKNTVFVCTFILVKLYFQASPYSPESGINLNNSNSLSNPPLSSLNVQVSPVQAQPGNQVMIYQNAYYR